MTTTPTVWKSKFTVNQYQNGDEFGAQSVGLSNGHILVVWDDAHVGTAPGRDIVGQLFHANGTLLGAPFQVNYTFENQNETAPKIVALPDGGFVVAYGSYNDGIGDFIVVERFNAAGAEVAYNLITENLGALNELHLCEITVDNNGNYIVAFDRWTGDGYDVRAIVYNYISNNPRPEYDAAQNESADSDHLGDIAAFTDGNVITISDEPDGSGTSLYQSAEYKITQSGTGNAVGSPVAIAGSNGLNASAKDVAVLTGGQFVVLYQYNGSVFALKIGSGDAPGSTLGPEIIVGTPQNGSYYHDASVVALKDGGFLTVWADSGTPDQLYATRYNATGTIIGSKNFVIANGLADNDVNILGQLQLTSDGRVLVPFRNSVGDISEVILDPREPTINGTNSSEELTTQTGDSVVLAYGGDDTVYGLGGDDWIDGGTGTDTLMGGRGNDVYFLSDLHQIDPMLNIYAYDSVIENANEGIDKVHVAYASSAKTTYVLPANVEYGVIDGSTAFSLTGNALNNQLTGNAAANTLDGGGGIDSVLFSGARSSYTISAVASGARVSGPDGTDTLISIEKLVFNNVTVARPPSDFNGDFHGDFLWQNTNGQLGIWLMNGLTPTSTVTVGPNPGPSWKAAGSGDFDGNGKADILWQNANGQPGIWLMDGTTPIATVTVGPNPGPSWKVAGSGDFDGDGKADILWQNTNGQPGIWLMDGITPISTVTVGPNPSPAWKVIGSGDFDGNGKSDILWQNDNGQPGVWLMDGTNPTSTVTVGPNPGSSWKAVGTGDFDADGKADILWQNTDGQPGIWLMDGTTPRPGNLVTVGPNPGTSWKVTGSADVDADGKADILWQNDDGQPGVWLMNGVTPTSTVTVGPNPGPAWQVVHQHHDLF